MTDRAKMISACVLLAAATYTAGATSAPAGFTVHQFAAPEGALFVNGYVVETPHRLIVVDATLTRSSATAFRTLIDSFHKPVAAYLVTHAHPDHYNGLSIVSAGSRAPVYASRDVLASIKAIDAAKAAQWTPVFKDEWPTPRRFPDHALATGARRSIDGVIVTLQAAGPAESHADSVWTVKSGEHLAAFVGDLVFNGTHSYMCDGHTQRWLTQLDRLRDVAPRARWTTLYPGHGAAIEAADIGSALERQTRYLQEARRLAASYGASGPDAVQASDMARKLAADLQVKGLEFMIDVCAAPLAKEVRGE